MCKNCEFLLEKRTTAPEASKQDTGIFVDFTGAELVEIGLACIRRGITFNEFIDQAIREAVESTLAPQNTYGETTDYDL